MIDWALPDVVVAARSCATDAPEQSGLDRVTILGGSDAFPIVLRTARAGLCVDVVEADADDAARLRDMLDRAGATEVSVAREPHPSDLYLVAPGWTGFLPDGAVRLGEELVFCGAVAEVRTVSCVARTFVAQLGLIAVDAIAGGLSGPLCDVMDGVAEQLSLEGAVPWEIDEAIEAQGFSQGPFVRQDEDGVDAGLVRRRRANSSIGPIVPRMVAEGRLGRKVGVGWYRYPGGGGRVIDPLIEDLVREEAWFAGCPQRSIGDAECVGRLVLGLMDTAIDLLDKGAAETDVDCVALHGLGYPARWVGPLSHARAIGKARLAPLADAVGAKRLADWMSAD